MRIRTKLTIVLLLVALVPLAGVSITSYVIGRRTVIRQILNQLESVASILKSRVESMLRQNDERLALLESRTALKSALETYASIVTLSATTVRVSHRKTSRTSSCRSLRERPAGPGWGLRRPKR